MPSLRARAVKRGFAVALRMQRMAGGGTPDPEGPEEELEAYALRLRDQLEQLASAVPTPRNAEVRQARGAPLPTEWVISERAEHERVVLHLHGGAYLMGSARTHRGMAAVLSRVARARVAVPDYRLAPEHRFPAALDDAVAAYRWLVDDQRVDPDRIAVTGDSAGGGLAISLLVRLREEGAPLPACYVGMSPWTDLAGTGDSMTAMNGADPWLRAELVLPAARGYTGPDVDLDHPLVSPLYADLHGLPPMLVHSGTEEILFDDGRRLVERARAADVDASFAAFDGLWHVFQAFPGLPETRRSLREIGAFIRRHTADAVARAA